MYSDNEDENQRIIKGLVKLYVNIAGLGIVLATFCLSAA